MKFDMHFVVNERLLKRLDKTTGKMKLKTRSATIVAIFNLLLPYLEKHQIKFKNNESKYRLVADLKETRRHIHAYVPEEVYRRLKELHEYSNFYSIAQILREIIKIYLKKCFKLGVEEAVKKLESLKRKWEMVKKMKMRKIFLRQLHDNNRTSPSLSITYDRFFHPLSIKFLS